MASGNVLAVARSSSAGTEVELFDISNRCAPVSRALLTGLPRGRIALGNNTLVVAPAGDTITIFDITDPSAPRATGTTNIHEAAGLSPLDESVIRDVVARGTRLYAIAEWGGDSFGKYGALHVLELDSGIAAWRSFDGIGSPARFRDLYLIGDLAVCTNVASSSNSGTQRDNVFFGIADPDTPEFLRWVYTFGCGPDGAIPGGPRVHVPLAGALYGINLSQSLCGSFTSLSTGSDGIHHGVDGQSVFVSGSRLYRSSGGDYTRISDIPVGQNALEVVGDTIYSVDSSTLYTYSAACGSELRWASPSSGNADDPLRWSPRAIPSQTSTLIFDQPAEFTAALSESLQVASIQVRQGEATIAGANLTLDVADAIELLGGTLVITNPDEADVNHAMVLRADELIGMAGASSDPELFDVVLERGGRWERVVGFGSSIEPSTRVKLDVAEGVLIPFTASTPTIGGGSLVIKAGSREAEGPALNRPGLLAVSSGRVEGLLENRGDLRVQPSADGANGSLVIGSDFVQTSTGMLDIVVGSSGGPLIDVAENARIDGTLRIRIAPGAVAKRGGYLPIIRAKKIDSDRLSAFARIEGVLDTGDPDVFWGIDVDRSNDEEHVIALVALPVPTRVSAIGTATPYRRSTASNIVLISHGTAGSAADGTPLHEIAHRMAGIASKYGRSDDFDIVTLHWSEFATNSIPRSALGLLRRYAKAVGKVLNFSSDSRGRAFNPYETARFSEHYAASVLRYLDAETPADAITPGAPVKSRIDLGAMRSIHTIGHSSGSYAAHALIDILGSDDSPFGGSRPAIRHFTALDAYLPPQDGGAFPWRGPALGKLGGSATASDHYFITDEAIGTNNEAGWRMRDGVVNFDISEYVKGGFDFGGHGVPIDFYLDSARHQLGLPPKLQTLPGVNQSLVHERFGVVFSPLMRGLSAARDVESVRASFDSSEYADGDIDVAKRRQTIAKRQSLLPRARVNDYATNVVANPDGSLSMRTGSPAIAEIVSSIEQSANAIEIELRTKSENEGFLSIEAGGELIGGVDLSELAEQDGVSTVGPFRMSPVKPGPLVVTLRLEPSASVQAAVEILDVRALTLLEEAERSDVSGGTAISAVATRTSDLTAVYVAPGEKVTAFERNSQTGQWMQIVLDGVDDFLESPVDAIAISGTDASSSDIAVLGTDSLYIIDPAMRRSPRNITAELKEAGATPIVLGAVTFNSVEGVVFIAGLDPAGELVMYWRPAPATPTAGTQWSFSNLDREHFAPQGLTRPAWSGETVSFVTSWNALNIIGLDVAGQVWSAWWAPGMPLWRVDNLSVITGSPPLAGGLTAYTTPWGAMNIVGLDASGAVQVVWWVPQFGADWRVSDLSRQLGHEGLAAGGLSSYVTPWGGTNVAGIDASGELVVYWWAPGLSLWAVSPLSAYAEDAILPIRSVRGVSSPDGTISIFGFGDEQAPARYYWSPSSNWRAERLK